MFKVLYAPFEGVRFERFDARSEDVAALVYEGTKGVRTLICAEEKKKEIEVLMMEAAAEWLNCSPSLEFTRLMLRSIKDAWKADMELKESDLVRRLRFSQMFGLDRRQPPFAPNNGERVDGIW